MTRAALESIVAELESNSGLDERGRQILADARTLGGAAKCSQEALRSVCRTWGVRRDGEGRAVGEVVEELQEKVVDAWQIWKENTGAAGEFRALLGQLEPARRVELRELHAHPRPKKCR